MYYIDDFDKSITELETMFHLTANYIEDSRWENFNNINGYAFYWMRIDDNAQSLVYIPYAGVVSVRSNEVIPVRLSSLITLLSSEKYGMRVVTNKGRNVIINDQLAAGRFAVPTKEELITYKEQTNCPRKYETTINRFIRKALSKTV